MEAVRSIIFVLLISATKSGLGNIAQDDNNNGKDGSFLWRVDTNPPSYFFGTIHVPYTRVWDAIPNNAKQAFAASRRIYFELDLTSPLTLSRLAACQLLPKNKHLSQELPSDLYARLKIHMEWVKAAMPSWVTADQKAKSLDANYLFSAITAKWERKRPIWVTLLVNSLTKSDIASRGYPVLDLYLSQLALKNRKHVEAIETVNEQCDPLNRLNKTQVEFTLKHTLKVQENIRLGLRNPHFSTDDLIEHYRSGNLDSVIFNQETIMFPSLASANKTTPGVYPDDEPMTDEEKALAKSIDDFFKEEMINKRNKRMASRVIDLLVQHPGTPFFFAFGAAHFVGDETVLDLVRSAGFTITRIGPEETLPELKNYGRFNSHSRTTVQGTFDDLSDEEKTRAYLQFLQYHQQLEQENETKKFQEMLNKDNNFANQDDSSDDSDDVDDESVKVWYGVSSSSQNLPQILIMILLTALTMLRAR